MQKITPFLWFDNNAEEAADFYTSIFDRSSEGKVLDNPADTKSGKKGSVMTKSFQLNGQDFIALNGGPHVKFNEAISFFILCEDQEEVDYFWDKLSAGGQLQQCGWLKDKFGLSWQVVPKGLQELLGDKDPARAKKALNAMMKMVKLDINELKRAAGE